MFKNLFRKKKTYGKWKNGIPRYKQSDLMSNSDMLIYAMNTYIDNELEEIGYTIISKDYDVDKIVNYVCEKNDETVYIYVKCSIYPGFPTLTKDEKDKLLKIRNEQGILCYFAPVGLASFDEKRKNASLALKGDEFRYRFRGLFLITDKLSDEFLQTSLSEIAKLREPRYCIADSNILVKKTEASYSRGLKADDLLKNPDDNYSALINIDSLSEDEFKSWEKTIVEPTFQEKLMSYIAAKGMKNNEFYKAALLDRKLFSAMNTNPNYQPKKETAIACCIGLKLSLDETEDLLKAAGYYLSLSITKDKVIYYCISNKIYDMDVINELLYAVGEKCIRL